MFVIPNQLSTSNACSPRACYTACSLYSVNYVLFIVEVFRLLSKSSGIQTFPRRNPREKVFFSVYMLLLSCETLEHFHLFRPPTLQKKQFQKTEMTLWYSLIIYVHTGRLNEQSDVEMVENHHGNNKRNILSLGLGHTHRYTP